MAGLSALGDPFGAMMQGKRAALEDTLKAGESARRQRDSDINYDFNKWYQPLKQAETQNKTGAELLHSAALNARYTGDYNAFNQILQNYYGMQPENLPPGFAGGKGGPEQTKAADIAAGNFPVPLSYPGVISAGGAYQALPAGSNPQTTGDPEIDKLHRALLIKQYQNLLNPPTEAPLPHLSPLGSIGQTTNLDALGSVKPPSQNSEAKTDLSALYGVPKPQQKEPNSIWEDEYNAGLDADKAMYGAQ